VRLHPVLSKMLQCCLQQRAHRTAECLHCCWHLAGAACGHTMDVCELLADGHAQCRHHKANRELVVWSERRDRQAVLCFASDWCGLTRKASALLARPSWVNCAVAAVLSMGCLASPMATRLPQLQQPSMTFGMLQ
jgi:hypothetical protein